MPGARSRARPPARVPRGPGPSPPPGTGCPARRHGAHRGGGRGPLCRLALSAAAHAALPPGEPACPASAPPAPVPPSAARGPGPRPRPEPRPRPADPASPAERRAGEARFAGQVGDGCRPEYLGGPPIPQRKLCWVLALCAVGRGGRPEARGKLPGGGGLRSGQKRKGNGGRR